MSLRMYGNWCASLIVFLDDQSPFHLHLRLLEYYPSCAGHRLCVLVTYILINARC